MSLVERLDEAYEREIDILNRQLSMGVITVDEHREAVNDLERDARTEVEMLSHAYRHDDGDDE
jgi:hypothetical protein